MTTSFTIFGLTFYWYGLLIGLGIAVAIQIAEWHLKRSSYDSSRFWETSLIVLFVGIVVARIWHVATDWGLYADNIQASLYIWNGGMSILGGLLGGGLATWIVTRSGYAKLPFLVVADVLLIGAPFGQAIGRIGNWINQELYGLPTDLPWGIYIEMEYRLSEFIGYSHYHPLFAYEMLALLLIGAGLWLAATKSELFQIGKGMVTLSYFVSYSLVRFFLEFFRVEKSTIGDTIWGVNQVIVGAVVIIASLLLFQRSQYLKKKR